ncbi:unnamed protein product, partial [Vitis vinifera]|uniref:Uncharacterized protein n=1 Tax=Vitis vinifera TaxID=29760 RepID=D7SSB1_VITVI
MEVRLRVGIEEEGRNGAGLHFIPPFSSPFPLSLCLSNSLLFVVVFFFFFCFILCPFSHSLVVCAYLICSHHQHLSFSSLLFLLVRNKHTSDPTRPFFFSSCLVLMDWAFSADQNWYCGDFDEIWGWIYDLRLGFALFLYIFESLIEILTAK